MSIEAAEVSYCPVLINQILKTVLMTVDLPLDPPLIIIKQCSSFCKLFQWAFKKEPDNFTKSN